MTEEKKKGFFANLFGTPKSSCCSVRIEEVPEEENQEVEKKETGDKRPKN